MRANSLVGASAYPNGVIVIEGLQGRKVKVTGGSVGNIPPNDHYSSSASFSLKPGESGMVLLFVYEERGRRDTTTYDFFLPVKWEDGQDKPYIDLQNRWVPTTPDRMAYLSYESLEVKIGDIIYSTSHYIGKDSLKRGVKDVSLLCRFIDGKISLEELEEAIGDGEGLRRILATFADKKGAAEELIEAREELTRLRLEVARLGHANKTHEHWRDVTQTYYRDTLNELMRWKIAGQNLRTAVENQHYKRTKVRAALDAFPTE